MEDTRETQPGTSQTSYADAFSEPPDSVAKRFLIELKEADERTAGNGRYPALINVLERLERSMELVPLDELHTERQLLASFTFTSEELRRLDRIQREISNEQRSMNRRQFLYNIIGSGLRATGAVAGLSAYSAHLDQQNAWKEAERLHQEASIARQREHGAHAQNLNAPESEQLEREANQRLADARAHHEKSAWRVLTATVATVLSALPHKNVLANMDKQQKDAEFRRSLHPTMDWEAEKITPERMAHIYWERLTDIIKARQREQSSQMGI